MAKKRLTFLCWHCRRTYSLLRELYERKKLFVACPFCGEKGVVDLAPYPKKTIQVYRGDSQGGAVETYELDLPETLPTRPPAGEEAES